MLFAYLYKKYAFVDSMCIFFVDFSGKYLIFLQIP